MKEEIKEINKKLNWILFAVYVPFFCYIVGIITIVILSINGG